MARASRVVIEQSTLSRVMNQSRIRLLCIGLFFVLCYGVIGLRLVGMMVAHMLEPEAIVVSGSADEGEEAVTVRETVRAIKRGDIVDRNGNLLATSLMMASLFADTRELRNPEEAAVKVQGALKGVSQETLRKRLGSGKSFVWIKRFLTPGEQQAVNNLGIPGLYFLPEERRVYPYGALFSHALGYVGVDGRGLAGLEKYMDAQLRDGPDGRDPLKLSLDLSLQHLMHDELRGAMEEFRAIGAVGVIADVHSGEILSMVSLPDFDPQKPANAKDAQKFNRATLGAYEMGSTFKSFTFAAALEYGTTKLNGGYDASQPFKLASATITDTHPKNRWLSVPEIYAYSSNIGTAHMAMGLGISRQQKFLKAMGMMQTVDIELPERAAPLYPKEWREINMVTISYGHGMSVTPLHLVRGIAALVNGGTLPKLTLLKTPNDIREDQSRVVSEGTSQAMRALMRLVVTHGTAAKAEAAGYRVGGKTGTAEKVQVGGYSENARISSFIGVYPIDAPRYAVLVMIDEPKGNKSTAGYATGGWVAAPVVGRVVARMAPMMGMKPSFDPALDNTDQYWLDTGKKSAQQARTQAPPPIADQRYIHAASY